MPSRFHSSSSGRPARRLAVAIGILAFANVSALAVDALQPPNGITFPAAAVAAGTTLRGSGRAARLSDGLGSTADAGGQDQTGTVDTAAGAIGPALVWERRFPGVTFRESSPVDADLGTPAFVVGGLNGDVYAFDATTGADLPGWPVRTGHPINSSPAAADLFGQGDEIVIGSGWADQGPCGGGAVLMIDPSATIRWKRAGIDPTCTSLAFHSSPAIGDITGAGTPDITIGALGLQSWSWTDTGTLNAGWPFYTDDTVFATPALADVTGDGVPEVILGGDSSPGGLLNWRGGVVRAVRGDGRLVWQYATNEMVRSSPVVGPVGPASSAPSIVFGTGNYWIGQPGGASDAYKVFSLDEKGRPQWVADLGGETIGSPALADVTGNGQRDVVIGTAAGPDAGMIWVLDDHGVPLPHWAGVPSGGGVVIGGVSTADLNGDGAQDVLVPTGAGVFVYDGRTARLLFSLDPEQVGFQSTPLVTEDAGGQLGITVAGTTADGIGVVQHWRLPRSSGAQLGPLGWPMFHHDERHTGNASPPPVSARQCRGAGIAGYWEAAADGRVFGWCGAALHGSPAKLGLTSPIVAMASSPSGHGYWEAAADGGVFAYGDATFLGSVGAAHLTSPIVGMTRTSDGRGYWLVAADGGVFAFGDAGFEGSAAAAHLGFRVVTLLPTPSGLGYWLIGDRGEVLTYGDAQFFGAPNGIPLTSPIVGGAPSPSGQGYWLVAADGGVFTYGDAAYLGSVGAHHLTAPIVAMAATAAGRGYWLIGADGGVFSFGDATFVGSASGVHLNGPVTAAAVPSG